MPSCATPWDRTWPWYPVEGSLEGRRELATTPGDSVAQSDFILRMIERFGQMLIALRNRIIRGDAPLLIEAELKAGSRQAGVDLDLVRSFTLESLSMFVEKDGEVELDRAWLMAEFLSLDGIHSARIGNRDMARDSLLKARALYDLVGPHGSMLIGIPDVRDRLGEIDQVLDELGPE